MEVITFKTDKATKTAVKIAAVRAGHNNVSEFIKALIKGNSFVSEELKKEQKRTRKN